MGSVELDNVPTEFPPSDHTHEYTEVNDGQGKTLDVEIAEILDHLATIDSELGSLSGNLTFAGTVQMSTSTITSLTAGRYCGGLHYAWRYPRSHLHPAQKTCTLFVRTAVRLTAAPTTLVTGLYQKAK